MKEKYTLGRDPVEDAQRTPGVGAPRAKPKPCRRSAEASCRLRSGAPVAGPDELAGAGGPSADWLRHPSGSDAAVTGSSGSREAASFRREAAAAAAAGLVS